MRLTELAQGEPWMNPEERQTAADLVQTLQQCFADRQIPETPFLTLRVRDYLVHHTLCRRLERSLASLPSADAPADLLPKFAEQIGKCSDRLRKSLKDLEDTAAKLAPPPPASTPSGGEKPANPLHNAKYIQDLIEEVGIDLNDPDFFADEDNFYDVPPYQRPPSTEPKPDPDIADKGAFTLSTPANPPESFPEPAQESKLSSPISPVPRSLSTVHCQRSTPPSGPSAPSP